MQVNVSDSCFTMKLDPGFPDPFPGHTAYFNVSETKAIYFEETPRSSGEYEMVQSQSMTSPVTEIKVLPGPVFFKNS